MSPEEFGGIEPVLCLNVGAKVMLTKNLWIKEGLSQPAITCSKLTIETLEQGVKYVQS